MPLRLDVKRMLTSRSERVKSSDLHPSLPWALFSLYNGQVTLWNYESQQLVKTFEICDLPVRTARFVERKSWIVTGSDDMKIRVFNYNTMEKVHEFDAHSDYIRSVAIHPTQPYILSSSDDMLIKLWNWEKNWTCIQVFEGHNHYVMQVVINPKDNNTFASASLDKTVKVWQLGSTVPNFTLDGHEKGVNCVDYYPGGDRPYLISGGDDCMVKVWDYQNKSCVHTLDGHVRNISAVGFHPELPIALSTSEDGSIRIWHSNTYRLESTLNYGLERVWCLTCIRGSNAIAIGCDEGSVVIKLGREEPAISMDSSGKIIWAKHCEIQQANLKTLSAGSTIKDGERLVLSTKDMGSCEVYPQSVKHSPNGRFVAVCGDGEYIIYTAMALRNKSFGPAFDFVWHPDSSQFAVKESSNSIKLFKNFKERDTLKPNLGCEALYGGALIGVRHSGCVSFYDWENMELVRRIEVSPKAVYWSDSGNLLSICTDDSFFVLKYFPENYTSALEENKIEEDGVEDAFDAVNEVQECVKTGLWIGDCFIYTNTGNRLNYFVGGEIVTISHLDRVLYLLGYIPKDSRLYLADKDHTIVSFSLLTNVLEYQTAIMRGDFSAADSVLPSIPLDRRNRVAHFLDKQGFKSQALLVSRDDDHKFELAMSLEKLDIVTQLARSIKAAEKWRQVAKLALKSNDFDLAEEAMFQGKDFGGLIVLASSLGRRETLEKLGEKTHKLGQDNYAFLAFWLLKRVDKCMQILRGNGRVTEAAMFAHCYAPSEVSKNVEDWKKKLEKSRGANVDGGESGSVTTNIGDAIADPAKYENLFPNFDLALKAEQFYHMSGESLKVKAGCEYVDSVNVFDRSLIEDTQAAEEQGRFVFNESIQVADIVPGHSSSPDINGDSQGTLTPEDNNIEQEEEAAPVSNDFSMGEIKKALEDVEATEILLEEDEIEEFEDPLWEEDEEAEGDWNE